MLTEMSLTQMQNKVVPFVNGIYNNVLIGNDQQAEKLEKAKYLFMNMVHRSAENIDKIKTIKCIYDMQDSVLIIFCSKNFASWYSSLMVSTYKFKKEACIRFLDRI